MLPPALSSTVAAVAAVVGQRMLEASHERASVLERDEAKK